MTQAWRRIVVEQLLGALDGVTSCVEEVATKRPDVNRKYLEARATETLEMITLSIQKARQFIDVYDRAMASPRGNVVHFRKRPK